MMSILSRVIKFNPNTGQPVKALKRWALPLLSILALIWVLIRVIPKPQRATYPCMKVAIPFASSLLIYLSGLLASALVFKKAFRKILQSKYLAAGFLLLVGLGVGLLTIASNDKDAYASELAETEEWVDPLGPNVPIGEAKGIIPGRVVWTHNPAATNENCDPDKWGDAYFLDKNCDQDLVDELLVEAILKISDEDTEEEAWSAIFKYFNSTHDKGDVGYADGEKIFIKVNAVHAWTTNNDLSIRNDGSYGNVDTSPQVILAVLRQLIYKAGVPQDAIYLADPLTQIFEHVHDKLSAEFPEVHYMSRNNGELRELMKVTNEDTLLYSDRGSVMQTDHHKFYDCLVEADYILNIPAMKGHRWGGVTFFAKNHFGSNTGDGSWRLHPGLHKAGSYDSPMRGEYKSYRVMVDLMAYKDLGAKTLIFIGDFLWGTSYEHDPPLKFQSEPFNNDWTSSIIVSLDPVAIASVGLDILQEEFQVEDLTTDPPRYTYARYPAVDDYLHQAASSEWWPDSVVYDPENDGTPMGSLGVHEHWNNAEEKKYSRNLGTGEGIELIYLSTYQEPTSTRGVISGSLELRSYMSPGNTLVNLLFSEDLQETTSIRIVNLSGQLVHQSRHEFILAHTPTQIPAGDFTPGYYVIQIQSGTLRLSHPVMIQ